LQLLVTGITPNGSSPSAGDRVNVSTTGLGENSQAIDHNEGLRIDFVTGLAAETQQNKSDQNAVMYTGHTTSHGAGWSPVQVNPGGANIRVNALMVAYNTTADNQQAAFFTDVSSNAPAQTLAIISSVQVFDSTGKLFGTAPRPASGTGTVTLTGGVVTDNNLSVKFDAGTAEIDGLLSDYRVEFRTGSAAMDRFTITNVTPQTNRSFDVGRVVSLDTGFVHADASLNVAFEDDGPTAAIGLNAGLTVTHDESSGAQTAGGATDTNSSTVAALFAGVTPVSQDYLNDDTTGNIYAQSASAVVNSTGTKSGADFVGATTAFSLAIASDGVDSGLQTTDGHSILLHKEGSLVVGRISGGGSDGQAALAIAINSSSGVLSLAQYASLKHPTGSNPDNSEAVSITDTALQAVVIETDGDGDQATASTNIGNEVKFLDDGPTASITLVSGVTVTHDETPGVDSGSNDTGSTTVGALFAGVVNPSTQLSTDTAPYAQNGAIVTIANSSFGADEEGATAAKVVSLVDPQGADSGLKTTGGTSILLFKEASGITGEDLVVGRIGSQSGQAAFAIALDQNGVISVAQYASLKHPTATLGDTSEAVSITDSALKAGVTVTDGDGDTATSSVNIGNEIRFLDDGPTIGTIDNGSVLFKSGQSVNGNLNDTSGVDGFASPAGEQITLGSFTTPLTLKDGATTLTGTLSSNNTVVTYKDSTNTSFFHLTLNETGGYTFTVDKDAPPITAKLDFSALKSGSPQETLTVAAGTTSDNVTFDGLIYSGSTPIPFDNTFTETGSGAKALSTYNLGAASTDDDLNPDSLGFGEKSGQASQMNPNEGWFAVAKDGQGNLVPLQGINFQIQGVGSVPSVQVDWITFDRDSSGNSTFDSAGEKTVTLPSGNNAVPFSIPSVDADGFEAAYVRYTYPGQGTNVGVRNINFSTTIAQALPPQDLPFGVTVTDGDGDTAKSTFTVTLHS